MSEEIIKRTKKEVELDLKIKQAELDHKLAEVEKTKAETEKMQSESGKSYLEYEKALSARNKEGYTDEENYVYRFSKDVSHHSVQACMSKLTEWHRKDKKCKMEIVFSSPGGSIIDGFELFDFIQELRNKGHHITTGSLGMAASMAGILLQAGDVRWIGHQAWLMIHRAAFGAIGKTYEVEDEVKLVKRIEERCVDIFVSRSRLSNLKIKRNWDRKDWWIDADEAVSLGLVDEVRAVMPEHQVNKKKPAARKAAPKKKAKKMYGRLKDPEKYGVWTKAIKALLKKVLNKARHWICKVGMCTLDKCGCECHKPK
jgi:ATP-dependent Clp endopeptidase proteolytic subunit ClpP